MITETFQPFHNEPLPHKLAPTLIDRFNSKEGYLIYPDVFAYLQQSSKSPHRKPGAPNRIVVGVITNSDGRVPDVLSSLGLRVSHLRHDSVINDSNVGETEDEVKDIDFTITSYDVGFEKPHRKIFDAAADMLKAILTTEGQNASNIDDWDLLYVGDEMEKDGVGATAAGWNAIVVDRGSADGLPASGQLDGTSYKMLVKGKEVDVLSDFSAMKNLKKQYPMILG